MTIRLHSTAVALALLLGAMPPASAQSIAYGEPPPTRIRTQPLAERYHVRLTSVWPDLPGAPGCENGGSETVEGTLTHTGTGEYAGTFTRKTRLLFCGAHGAPGAESGACNLVLDGEGGVEMRGIVVPDEHSPGGRALRVVWTPLPEPAVRVTGPCGAEFKLGVERMYRSVRHGAEFALPNAGAAPRTERLEDYAWVVSIE